MHRSVIKCDRCGADEEVEVGSSGYEPGKSVLATWISIARSGTRQVLSADLCAGCYARTREEIYTSVGSAFISEDEQ